MILLHRLRTQNFKQLAEVSIQFPEKGTVLIEGLNEAGKSSLFEAVFFALYGRTLVPDQDYHIADLKSYGADEMAVELDFSIDGRPFSISRRVRSNHKAALVCPGAEGVPETIRTVTAIAERLKEEMRLSAEALLNTCFVEQKGLERLESLNLQARRETVNELLNLRVLTALEQQYRILERDQEQLRVLQQRVRIAELDARLPQLQEAAQAARRCLLYVRVLAGEDRLRELQQSIDDAEMRQAVIQKQRDAVRHSLEQAEQLKIRLRAIEGDMTLRVRAWEEALRQRDSADQRVRDLEALAAWIPGEEARLQQCGKLRERLEELEGLELEAQRAEEALRQAIERLAHWDEIEEAWRCGEVRQGKLAEARGQAEAYLAAAEERLEARRIAVRHSDQLALLGQQIVAWGRAVQEVEGLKTQLAATRENADRLAALKGRREALQGIDTRLGLQEQERSQLARLEEELSRSRGALSAAMQHQDQIRQLETDLAKLEQQLEGARTDDGLAGAVLHQAEARVALEQWADAAERRAEADPESGRLAEVIQQCARMEAEWSAAKAHVTELGRRLRLPAAAGAGSLLLSAAATAAHHLAPLGLAGLILAVAAIVWALGLGRQLTAARAAAAKAQRIGDALEGERRAIEAQAAAAAAQRDRWAARERECRLALEQLRVEIPPDAEGGRQALVALPEVAVSAAQERHRSAQVALNALQAQWEVAQRTLDAERSRAAGLDLEALADRIAGIETSQSEHSERLKQFDDLPAAIQALGLRSAADLSAAMDTARHEEADSATAARALPDLEGQLAQRTQTEADERRQAEELARALDIEGPDPNAWSAAAQTGREAFAREVEATPDAVLEDEVREAREALLDLQQQEGMLQGEQSRRREELDQQSREELVTAERECRTAIARNAEAQRPLGNVRPALNVAGLPIESAALRIELAVAQSELQRARGDAETLPTAREERACLAKTATQRQNELAGAWQRQLELPAPAAPDEAMGALESQRELAQRELLALDESHLRKVDEQLRNEEIDLTRDAAAWARDREQAQEQRRMWLDQLGQLGVDANLPLPMLPEHHPELAAVAERDAEGWETELQSREEAVRANRSDRRAVAQPRGIEDAPLELAAEQAALAETERDLAVRRRAGQIVVQTRQSIVQRVMPLTMQNMRLILPLLTEGRYQDAEWDEPSNAISVFDNRAGSFQRKRVFSGGARDQISLALRLAFALATLPGEQNVRPGWLFLDEPLSSFDHPRTQALVDLLTLPRALIRRQFAQIFLISHSQSFDPSQFDYRIRMDAGRVVESTLPSATAACPQQALALGQPDAALDIP